MFKVVEISKIGFFNFSGIERVKQNNKKVEKYLKSPELVRQFSSNSNKSRISFRFLTDILTLWLLVSFSLGHNTVLASNGNISKSLRVKMALSIIFFKEYSTCFLMISRFKNFEIMAF